MFPLVFAQARGKLDLAPVANAAHPRRCDHGTIDNLRRFGGAADGVCVVVVAARLLDEVEYVLMHVAQPVFRVVRAALHLVPDDVVAQRPALLVDEVEGNAPRDADEALVLVGVADVEPEGPRGL